MPSQSLNPPPPSSGIKKQRISTLLFVIQVSIASLVMMGLFLMIVRMNSIQTDLHQLRDTLLPKLMKLSQLSQESSASISIAPALSTNPTRFEFETLLSRIKDKEGSQKTLIKELGELIDDENAERLLKKNSELLVENLQTLTDVVRQQIGVRKRLEQHIEALHRMARSLSKTEGGDKQAIRIIQLTNTNIFRVLNILLDPNRARFSRSKRELAAGIEELNQFSFKNEPEEKSANGF